MKSKRLLALLLVVCLFVSSLGLNVSAADYTPLRQNQSPYQNYWYNKGNLYDTGCGIFALVNAVGYLTGNNMSVTDVASWAYGIKAYNKYSAEGTYRNDLYPNAVKKYGSTYGFTNSGSGYWEGSSSSTLKNHLKNGGVAIGHVPGHFIALVGYNGQNNTYHVIDSYPTNARGTRSSNGNCWKTAGQLATGKLKLDWFYLLSATSVSGAFPRCSASCTTITNGLKDIGVDSSYSYRAQIAAVNGISGYRGTAAQNNLMLRMLKAGTLKMPGTSTNTGTSSMIYFPRCSTSCTTITDGLKNIGIDSSYAYRKKIAAANGISDYRGTAAQNNLMLSMLKAGTLKKP